MHVQSVQEYCFSLSNMHICGGFCCRRRRGCLKGHSQLVHMRIRYHFIANLHITLHISRSACEEECEKRTQANLVETKYFRVKIVLNIRVILEVQLFH